MNMQSAPDKAGPPDWLWCLHAIGPDEVHPAPNFETAQRWANWANETFATEAPQLRFVVAVWPWDDASHASGLAKSIQDWEKMGVPDVSDSAESKP